MQSTRARARRRRASRKSLYLATVRVVRWSGIPNKRQSMLEMEQTRYGFLTKHGAFGAVWYVGAGDVIETYHSGRSHDSKMILLGMMKPEEKPAPHPTLDIPMAAVCEAFDKEGQPIRLDTIERLELPVGRYYPRVWRGIDAGMNGKLAHERHLQTLGERRACADGIHAANSLFSELERLFRTVSPAEANYAAYGDKIRELLILACSEIDTQFRAIYLANDTRMAAGTTGTFKATNMKHYRKLLPLLRLDEWVVTLKDPNAPWIHNPFRDWPVDSAPDWYKDYNAVKHDRARARDKANLGNVIKALAAVHILQVAQWGPKAFDQSGVDQRSAFTTHKAPRFGVSEQFIVLPTPYLSGEPLPYFSRSA